MKDRELEYLALKRLEINPRITQRELAEDLGMSPGKTNYIIKSLLEVGWLKLSNFRRSNNKIGYSYILIPKGVSNKTKITQKFLERKRAEYKQLALEIKRLEEEVSGNFGI